jgi:hypothetical protein
MANKHVDLFKEIIPAIDLGLKDLWDAAEDEGRKEIIGDLWNLNRYISSVKGDFDKQALILLKVNEFYNKNYNVIQKEHKKLLWLTLCVAGKTGKKEFHPWIKLERKKDTSNKAVKTLSEIYPTMKWDEVELLARISTKKELKELFEEHGYEKVDF